MAQKGLGAGRARCEGSAPLRLLTQGKPGGVGTLQPNDCRQMGTAGQQRGFPRPEGRAELVWCRTAEKAMGSAAPRPSGSLGRGALVLTETNPPSGVGVGAVLLPEAVPVSPGGRPAAGRFAVVHFTVFPIILLLFSPFSLGFSLSPSR